MSYSAKTGQEIIATMRAEDTINRARRIVELEQEVSGLRRIIGYLCMERGRDGEIMISDGTLLQYEDFDIEKEEQHRGGVLIRATPKL